MSETMTMTFILIKILRFDNNLYLEITDTDQKI